MFLFFILCVCLVVACSLLYMRSFVHCLYYAQVIFDLSHANRQGRKALRLPECDRAFAHQSALIPHIAKAHGRNTSYGCTECVSSLCSLYRNVLAIFLFCLAILLRLAALILVSHFSVSSVYPPCHTSVLDRHLSYFLSISFFECLSASLCLLALLIHLVLCMFLFLCLITVYVF